MRFPLHTSSVFWVSAFKSFRGVSNPDFQTAFNLNVTYSNIGYKKSQPIYIFRYHVKLTLPSIFGLQKIVNPNCAQCFLNDALCFVKCVYEIYFRIPKS